MGLDMISWDRVAELKDEVGEDVFDEIVELFLEETEVVVEKLVLVTDADEAEALLHFLKGSALNLGFSALSTLCQELGDASRHHGTWPLDLDRVSETYQASKKMLIAAHQMRATG